MVSELLLAGFTLFACLAAGVLAVQAYLALTGRGEGLTVPALAIAGVAVAASVASFMVRVQHWERFFKVFANLGSGITQAVLATVVLLAVVVVWAVVLGRTGETPRALAAAALALCLGAAFVLGRYHATPTRMALSWGMSAFYLVNAVLLGACALWAVAAVRGRRGRSGACAEADGGTACCEVPAGAPAGSSAGDAALLEKGAAVFSAAQLAATGVLVALAGATKSKVVATAGVVLDPTRPAGSGAGSAAGSGANLAAGLIAGDGAVLFWVGAVLAVAALVLAVCAVVTRRRGKASCICISLAGILCAFASSALVRVALYQVAFNNLAMF